MVRAGARSPRGRTLAGLIAAWVLPCGGAAASTSCFPPLEVKVCQDRYGVEADGGPAGGVFLRWQNQHTYDLLRLYVDGELTKEVPGWHEIACLEHLAPDLHEFAIEGDCEGTSSARVAAYFEVLEATPYEDPVPPFTCSFNGDTIQVELDNAPADFHSIDVLRRRNSFKLYYVTTVPGNTRSFSIPNSQYDDLIFLQFFDGDCYGSSLVGCKTLCLPVRNLDVCQDRYGDDRRVFVEWLPARSVYSRFEVSVDGQKAAEVNGWKGLAYVEDLEIGTYTFGVKAFCEDQETEEMTVSFEVVAASPHQTPLSNLSCRFRPAKKRIDGVWALEGHHPSRFVDVYLRKPASPELVFVQTIGGAATQVEAGPAGPDDELVLQFFSESCYGSPFFSCRDDGLGEDGFVRADANGDEAVDLSDSILSLNYLFLGLDEPLCFDAADANDDGGLDIADPIYSLNWLFSGGPPPLPPGGTNCGTDPTADRLPRCLTASCPDP